MTLSQKMVHALYRVAVIFNVVAVIFLTAYFVTPMVGIKVWSISGLSMTPTLQDGDVSVNLKTGNYVRGDIVCIESPTTKDEFWVKRVIGVPGDTIQVFGDYIEVNGKPDKISLNFDKSYSKTAKIVLLYNEYFVAGDNRSGSYDSRYVGPILEKTILSERLFGF